MIMVTRLVLMLSELMLRTLMRGWYKVGLRLWH